MGERAGMERGWPHPFETTGGGACLERLGRKGDRGLAKDRSAFFFLRCVNERKEGRKEGSKEEERKKERKEERMHINFIVFFFFNNYLRTRSIT